MCVHAHAHAHTHSLVHTRATYVFFYVQVHRCMCWPGVLRTTVFLRPNHQSTFSTLFSETRSLTGTRGSPVSGWTETHRDLYLSPPPWKHITNRACSPVVNRALQQRTSASDSGAKRKMPWRSLPRWSIFPRSLCFAGPPRRWGVASQTGHRESIDKLACPSESGGGSGGNFCKALHLLSESLDLPTSTCLLLNQRTELDE